ncbi:MAG: hypothetical protein D6762_08765 [Candidatus Neomarinimicrobiota bacterium]|nr:MAG: hypothetical protein D6762_08765 [Candidatus Neomarinimicrobiota bacterium]
MKRKTSRFSLEGVILVGLLATFLVVMMAGWFQASTSRITTPPEPDELTAVSPITMDIAQQFDCSCGTCSDNAAECQCSTAKATRNFIEKQVRQGKSEQEIIHDVQSLFGYDRG